MKGKRIVTLVIAVFVVMFVASAVLTSTWLYRYAHSPLNPDLGAVTVYIPPGSAFVSIAEMLEREGLIDNRRLFYLLARIRNVHHDLKAGEYELSGGSTPLELMDKLRRGDVKVHWVTIPEGLNMFEVADRFAARGFVDRDRFVALLSEADFLASLGIEADSAEGYLYPDTYAVTRSAREEDIIRFIVRRFHEEVSEEMVLEAEKLGYSFYEILTIASLVEKEARVKEEMPLISAVFHNRLKKGMRLQSDPTAIYLVDDFEGRIRRRDLQRPTPYNTYRISGLPPGPICNPGIEAIRAALNPAPVDYLYFVSKNDGTHHFSTYLSDHNRAVIKYQIKREK